MKVVVKGLVCDVGYVPLEKDDGFWGMPLYSKAVADLKGHYDFLEIVEDTEDYTLYKCFNITSEKIIKELYNLHYIPSKGDYIGIDGKEYFISRTTCWEDGVVILVTTEVVEYTLTGNDLETAKNVWYSLKAVRDEKIKQQEDKSKQEKSSSWQKNLSRRLKDIFSVELDESLK